MPKAVVLLSGGLDSATVLAIAQSQGFECAALTVLYGQRHAVEIEAAKRVAEAFGVIDHKFVRVELDAIGGSALTANIDVPKDHADQSEIPITYVPARNTIMLSLALGYAEVLEAEDVFVGMNAVDYSGYPDCRPEYLEAFARMAGLATRAGVEGHPTRFHAPLMHDTKVEIIEKGLALGVDFGMTHSCYDPDGSRACAHCDACLIRKAAFESLGMTDPALL